MIAMGTLLLLGGCMNPDTPMNPAAETGHMDGDHTASPTTPQQGSVNPSLDRLNHTGTADQNGGSSSTSGATGSAGQ